MRAPIKGFPNYVATMEGDIINVQSNKKLSGTTVSLRRGKETHPKRKDRIIANAYLGPSKRRIIHIDGNPENCAVSNLAYHSKAGAVAIFEDGVALYGRNLDRNYLSDRGAHTLHPLEFAAPHAIKAAFPQIKRLIKC